jgi:uncharacterized protein YbcI
MCPPGGDAPDDDQADRGNAMATLSAEMVRLYKEQFGRGPTKARSSWSGRDMVVVLLEDTLTPAERNLVYLGEFQRLRDTRMLFQYSFVKQFCAPVERITGRKVRSFISGIDAEADGTSLEVFVLHPDGYDGPSRGELAVERAS